MTRLGIQFFCCCFLSPSEVASGGIHTLVRESGVVQVGTSVRCHCSRPKLGFAAEVCSGNWCGSNLLAVTSCFTPLPCVLIVDGLSLKLALAEGIESSTQDVSSKALKLGCKLRLCNAFF